MVHDRKLTGESPEFPDETSVGCFAEDACFQLIIVDAALGIG